MAWLPPAQNLETIFSIFKAFAEFEHDMVFERTHEGRARARLNPGYHEGRNKKYTTEQIDYAVELMNTHSIKHITELTGLSKSTLCRERKKRSFNTRKPYVKNS